MRETDYAYAVAVIRSHEGKLLTRQDIDSLRTAESAKKCLGRLRDKGWGGADAANESAVLNEERSKAWALIKEVAPDFDEFSFLFVKNDFHNLKTALKAIVMQSDFRPLCMEPCLVDIETVAKAVEERDFERLPEFMSDAGKNAYTALTEQGDGQLCELILDKAALEAAVSLARKVGEPADKLAQTDAFAADVRIAVRCARMKKSPLVIKSALAECGRIDTNRLSEAAAQGTAELTEYLRATNKDAGEALEKSLSTFNAYANGLKSGILEAHKYDPLGIAPLICYIIRREEEISAVRTVLAEIRNGVFE